MTATMSGDQKMQEVNVRVAVRVYFLYNCDWRTTNMIRPVKTQNIFRSEQNQRMIRPLLPKEKLSGETTCVKLLPSTNQVVLGKDRAFTFDHVLPSKTNQQNVYDKCVNALVRDIFEGYNSTVFAYGQTGSGKTYTIGGGNVASQTEEEFGILPRAIKHIFEMVQENHNRDYMIKVSYVEIYKEEVRDLLDWETPSKDINIREDDKGNTLIMGASELQCEALEEVMSCLEQGSAFRHTGTTQMNEHSSRSHSIFTLYLEQKWVDNALGISRKHSLKDEESDVIEETGEMHHFMCGKFHFVDLAGSERAHRTGNVGDRFKESVHINSGLLALGNVISALGDPKKKVLHIPYRDSKITRLLKDSLGGNAHTVMICCVSPASSSFDESLNALKYANRARNIRNKPIVNRDPHSIRFEEMQTEIIALREELNRQRTSFIGGTSGAMETEIQRAIQDAGQIKPLEEKVARLQTECSHYRMIAEEAYKQLVDIGDSDILSQSQTIRLRDWLELMDEIKNKVPTTLDRGAWENQTIVKLKKELHQCQSDLKSDEEIFAEKTKEVNTMNSRINELEMLNEELSHHTEEAEERSRKQEEQMVEQQVKIEELLAKVKELEEADELEESQDELSLTQGSLGPPTTNRRRAKSVPVHMLGNRTNRAVKELATRNIHTSPAIFSLERVMAGFRARSQLLLSRLEDSDDVMTQRFSDEEGEDTPIHSAKDKSPFQRNDTSRGTYKVAKPKVKVAKDSDQTDGDGDARSSVTDDEKILAMKTGLDRGKVAKTLRGRKTSEGDLLSAKTAGHSNAELQQKRLKQTELDVRQSTQKMKDLSINIKMKEQLIKELIKTGQDAQRMNKQYEDKIKGLEKEKQLAKQEMTSLQKAMQEVELREQHDRAEKDKLQNEFRKKMELAKTRIHALQKKQKETEKMATLTGGNDKRIYELEHAVDKMRNQQDMLHKKLKGESDRKAKLEREMQKEQQKIRELEIRNDQQKKVLKIKTEEVVAAQRKLRTASQITPTSEEQNRLDEQKRWLDGELEKVLEQRKQMEDLEKELEKREHILSKKEAMLAEKSELEMKKLRSSQLLTKDIMTVAGKLESMDRKIKEKADEVVGTPREMQSKVKDELKTLMTGRERLRKQRGVLDDKLQEGSILSPQEERRLIEIDEAIDALDAAIEYKNDAITCRRQELRKSVTLSQSEDNLMSKLKTLSPSETRVMLSKYFEKVIDLKDQERKKELVCRELEMRVEDQEHQIHEVEAALQRAAMEKDRQLTLQQQEYERKIQVLMHQLAEGEDGSSRTVPDKDRDAKIQQLEKDLYYYKKTSRELKKKLRELMAGFKLGNGETERDGEDELATPREYASRSSTPRTNSAHSSRPSSHRSHKESEPNSARTVTIERHSHAHDGVTPVRISRKDLRRMSDEEVSLRLSAASTSEPAPADSLEASRNPWN